MQPMCPPLYLVLCTDAHQYAVVANEISREYLGMNVKWCEAAACSTAAVVLHIEPM